MRVQAFKSVGLGSGPAVNYERPVHQSRSHGVGEPFNKGGKFPFTRKVFFHLDQKGVPDPRFKVIGPDGNVDPGVAFVSRLLKELKHRSLGSP